MSNDLALPRIVGLAGYAGSGKDLSANILCDRFNYERRGFADALKALATTIGWDGRKDDTGRRLLQELGVGARDVLGADVWVDALMRDLPGRVVITDVRFPNEVEAIWDRGGVVVKVVRPGVGPARGHVSETAIDHLALPIVVNDGDVFDLHAALLDVLAGCPTNP
jgi:hypothetical protein